MLQSENRFMTLEKYKALINASGGFTKEGKRGDRTQYLTKEVVLALTQNGKKSDSL